MLSTSYSKFLGERYATYWGTSPDDLWDKFAMATDAGVEFRLAPLGRKPFHAPTSQPTIFVICDDNMQKTGPRAVHQGSLREFCQALHGCGDHQQRTAGGRIRRGRLVRSRRGRPECDHHRDPRPG